MPTIERAAKLTFDGAELFGKISQHVRRLAERRQGADLRVAPHPVLLGDVIGIDQEAGLGVAEGRRRRAFVARHPVEGLQFCKGVVVFGAVAAVGTVVILDH